MTACVNCARALQPAWKYCIFCGTRTAVAATAPRSRPLPTPASGSGPASGGSRRASAPARTSVPALSGSSTAQTPVIPVGAPAPLAAAPNVPPVSSEWPETMGERPSLRSALAATDVPPPTPPAAPVPAPEDDEEIELEASSLSIAELAAAEPETTPELEAAEPEAAVEPAPRRPRGIRRRPDAAAAVAVEAPIAEPELEETPVEEAPAEEEAPVEEAPPEDVAPIEKSPAKKTGTKKAPVEKTPVDTARGATDTATTKTATKKKAPIQVFPDVEPELDLDPELENTGMRADRAGRVNLLAVLALLLGVLASPLAALFGHVALGQLRASGERGVIPAWIAIVLGYLWLGFFLVLGITYLATNG